jgi:hypothetical protein
MSKMTSPNAETRSTAGLDKASHGYSGRPNSVAGLSWSLPSGEGLAEFAWRFGFLAPRLLGSSSARVLAAILFLEAR